MVRDNDPATTTDFQEPVYDADGDIQRHLQEFNPPQQLQLEIPTFQYQPQTRICSEDFQNPPSSRFVTETPQSLLPSTQNQPRPRSFSGLFQDPPCSQFAMARDNNPATITKLQEPVHDGKDEEIQWLLQEPVYDEDGEIQRNVQEFNPPQQLHFEIPTFQDQLQTRIYSEDFQDPPSSQFSMENSSDQSAETDLQEPVHDEDGEIQRHVQELNPPQQLHYLEIPTFQYQPHTRMCSENFQDPPSSRFAIETPQSLPSTQNQPRPFSGFFQDPPCSHFAMVRDNNPATMNDFQEPVYDVDGDIQRQLQEFNPPPTRICSENVQDPPFSQFAVESSSDQAAETDHQEPVHYEDGGIQRHVQEFNSQGQPQPQSFPGNSQELPSRQFAKENDNKDEDLPNLSTQAQVLTGLPQPLDERLEDGLLHALHTQPFVRPILSHSYPDPPLLPVKRCDQNRRCSVKHSAPKNPEKGMLIQPPFRWATDRRATVNDLKTLAEKGIKYVSGDVCCMICRRKLLVSYNIGDEFAKLRAFVEGNQESLRDRAPPEWTKPALPECRSCEWKNCCKPVIAEKKRMINWLFLLLGSFLGCCSVKQLKYFCKHTLNYRTGTKDRLLCLAYLGLCKQLDETGPFDPLD